MLTEQIAIMDSLGTDTIPLGFISTEDGRVLLAVAVRDNGVLKIMAAPVALMPQSNPMSPFIKTTDGNLILHPPLVQISLEDIMESGIQQAALLPIPTLPTTFGQAELSEDMDTRLVVANASPFPFSSGNYAAANNRGQMTQNENTQPPVELKIPVVERSIHKRSPGRPRKIGAVKSARSMKCDICRQEFTKQSLYRKHMEHHAEEKPHRCPKCPASFNIPTNFTLHMATHNTGEPKCPECGRKYARMASLKSHMLLHAKEENLFCTECEDAFSTKAQLDAHLKLHGEKWSTEDVRKCKLCNKQFVQPALYRLHIREHYRLQTKIVKQTKRGAKHKTVYKCTICLKSFQKPSQLMRHIRVHTGEKPFKCTVCGRAFTQKSSLQIHMWQHNGIRPHTCSLCNAKFSQKGNLNAHILRAHNAPEGEPIYGCTYCTCTFKKLGSLNGHIKRMHSSPTTADSSTVATTTTTSRASATAPTATTESSTITLKTEEVPPRSDDTEAEMRNTVDNVMSQLASLESTVNSSANSTEPTAASRNDILQQALKNSGLPSKIKNSSDDAAEPKKAEARTTYVTLLDRAPDGSMRKYVTIKQRCIGNIRWYACSFCHKEFKKPSDLIRHLRVHTQEKPYKCSYCFRSFALKSTMIAHERTHTGAKKYTCGSCDKTFACHSSLIAHARLHAKPHKCNICGKSFGASAILKGHMKLHAKPKSKISPEAESLVPQVVLQEPLVISDVGNKISVAQVQSKQKQIYENADVARPHKCWVCHAAFRKISHLKQHYRRHTGERPYKCTKCDRRFTSNSVLKSHLHTHDDLRPYSCPVCNTKFSTQSSMKRHLVTHSNKRPFMCPYCQKTFKTYVNCRKHMKIHKHELAERQLEQQKTQEQTAEMEIVEQKSEQVIPENLSLSEDMEVSFQPQMAPDFSQVFSEQFQTITEEREKYLPSDNVAQSVVNQNMSEVDANNLTSSQTLHADESGTITLPNYSGDQTLTPESIREIEETLNQQLFNIGMNFGLGNNLSKQIDDTNTAALDNSRQQPVLNIIYENNKGLESSGNTIFPSQFESFDISQIGLQTDNEIDMLNTGNTTNMASILPRSIQEEQRLITMTTTADKNPVKTNMHLSMNAKQPCPDLLSLLQAGPKYPKIAAKADTTNNLIQKVNSEIKIESNMDIVASRNERNSLSFTDNFQDAVPLNAQTLHALPSQPSNIDTSAVNVSQCESLLQCHMCSKQGFTTAGLKEHLKTHRGAKEYQCTECSLRFCTNGGLSRHLKMHTNKQQWKCSVCQKVFGSKVDLKFHNKDHGGNCYPTSVEPDSSQNESVSLDTSLPSIQSLGLRMSTDSSISEKVLLDTVAEKEIMDRLHDQAEKKEKKEYINKCKYCPKTFRKPSDLTRHIRTHTGERPYKCDYCHKSFAVKCTLDSHTKVHTGKKTFCCHVCNSFFATKGSLKVHMRLHTGSKPFRCPICDLRFRTSGHRKVHLLKHVREHKGSAKRKHKHLKVAAVAEVVASLEKSIENVEQPVTAAAAINNNNTVAQTIDFPNLDAINIDQTINATGMSNHITFNADGTIMNNNSLLSINESNQLVANLHFLLANGLVTIQADDTLIPQTASTDAGVVQDEPRMGELMGSNALQVPCDNTNANHIVITPVNPPPVVAAAQEPTTTIQLSNGMVMQMAPSEKLERMGKQIVKTQSKKECDICGKTFMKPYQVERHKRIHTGERPFKCNLCPKSFAQKSTLQMHQKHHTGDRPHPCPHCEYSFTQKGNLQTHLRRVHQLDALEIKKLKKGQQLSAKPTQEGTGDTKILSLDEISIVEFLK